MKLFCLFFVALTCYLRADPVTIKSVNVSVGSNYSNSLIAVRNYENNPNGWAITNLFDVAIGYVNQKKLTNAVSVYQKILSDQPTNATAIRGLGTCYVLMGNYDMATIQYKRGWTCGDDKSILNLANLYLMTSQISEIKPLVPDLLAARERMADSGNKHEITNVLIVFSLKGSSSPDKEIFLTAMDGLSDDFILSSKDTTALAIPGLKIFGYQNRADELSKRMEK